MEMITALTSLVLALGAIPSAAQQPFADGGGGPAFDADPGFAGEAFRQDDRPEEPFLQWNGEAEDVYRRAVHLMDVRARYAEAAETLLALMDQSTVIQVPGQASWVGAKAAEALYQAGRSAEAEALLPGIRRGAQGTEFEEPVTAMLAYLERYRQEAGELDPVFLSHVENALASNVWSSVAKYGRQAHPYLLHLMRAESDRASGLSRAQRALAVGLSTANAAFVAEARQILASWPALRLATVLDGFGLPDAMDREAQDLRSAFLLEIAANENPMIRASCMRTLVNLLHREGDPRVADFMKEALHDPEFPVHRELLDALVYNEHRPVQREVLEHAAFSPVEEVAELSRWKIASSGIGLPLLANWATEGDREDQIRFLAPVIRSQSRIQAVKIRWSRAVSDAGGDPQKIGGLRPISDQEAVYGVGPGEGRRDAIVQETLLQLVRKGSGDVQVLAAIAAAQWKSWEALRIALGTREPWLEEVFAVWNADFPPALDDALLSLLGDPEFADAAAEHLLESDALARLAPAELHRLGDHMTPEQWLRAVHEYREAERWDWLHEVVQDDGVPEEPRFTALTHLDSQQRGAHLHMGEVVDWGESIRRESLRQGFQWAWKLRARVESGGSVTRDEERALLELAALVASVPGTGNDGGLAPAVRSLGDFQPEQAHALILQMLQSDETRPVAAHLLAWWSGDVWHTRAVLAALQAGVDLEETGVTPGDLVFGSEEKEAVCRLLLERGDSVGQVLHGLRQDPALRHALESEIQKYWNDPEFAPLMVAIYAEAPDAGQWVPKMLDVWDLQGIQTSDRSSLLYRYGLTLDERFAPLLLDQLGSPEKKIAEEAARALERMREVKEQRAFWETWQATGGAQSPALALLRKVDDEDPVVRIAAIRSLGTLGAKEALPKLIELLEDENPEVRAAAAEALDRINDHAPTGTPERPEAQESGGGSDDGSGD